MIVVELFGALVKNQIASSAFQMSHTAVESSDDESPRPGVTLVCDESADISSVSGLEDVEGLEIDSPACLEMAENIRDDENPILANLETAVGKGVKILEQLRDVFEDAPAVFGDDTDWVTSSDETIKLAEPERVVIGVVGSTGAGKSSLINAIVDEENILSTNCMRASTAVATEISYNHGHTKYKAEIEFIQPGEWEHELNILFRDIEDSKDDDAPNAFPKDSEAAVAFEKIMAVYPSFEQEDVMNSSVQQLMNYQSVADVLGSTVIVEEDNPKSFSDKIASYLDCTGTKAKKCCNRKDQLPSPRSDTFGNLMQLWPLIRVVRIYVKADALSTGAILVDLPGMHDSNAARMKVAENYMKRCSAHWIVAPINRAVNDKVARDLLNKNFKTQLQMDDAFDDITFICTKTDDISVSETVGSLGLELQSIRTRDERHADHKARAYELNKLHAKNDKIAGKLENLESKIDELEMAGLTLGDNSGNPTQPSPLTPQKRSRQDDELENATKTPPATPKNAENSPPSAPPSVEQSSKRKLAYLKHQKKELLAQKRSLKEQIQDTTQKADQAQTEVIKSEKAITQQCVEARNTYSRQEIKSDFAAGIRELDREALEDSDAQAGKARDYSELEEGLPVFCVSSRAYQKLRGRSRRDTGGDAFTTLEATGVPAVQKHFISMTEKARERSSRSFLTQLNQQLQSIGIWASVSDQSSMDSDADREEMETGFKEQVANLVSVSASILLLPPVEDALGIALIFPRQWSRISQGFHPTLKTRTARIYSAVFVSKVQADVRNKLTGGRASCHPRLSAICTSCVSLE